jgi:poly-gamma-glutamate capsule biosynthesis protein CapA/YwtB (metallophosphatase superfamily)
MTGRGVDPILPRPSLPRLHEPVVTSALDYVALAERASGPIPRGVAPADVWGALPQVLARARPDARVVNLETGVTTSEAAEPKGIHYRVHPGNVAVLAAARIDCCVLGNNHGLAWGRAGLLETLDALAAAGIRVPARGATSPRRAPPAALPLRGGGRVLVVAFGVPCAAIPPAWAAGAATPGVHLLPDLSDATLDEVSRLVARARLPGDVVVASVHWGPNWGYRVPPPRRRFAHALVDEARVDVVHGHSSHHPLAIEVHRGRPILHGCGDFLNDSEGIGGRERYRGDRALAYFPKLDARTGALARLTMAPLQLRGFRPRYAAPADREWPRERLDRECRRFGHAVALRDGMLVLAWA